MDKLVFGLTVMLLMAVLLMMFGCSGGVSASVGASGSLHDPSHPRLPEIVEATPIIRTTTSKSWSLPMVKGGE